MRLRQNEIYYSPRKKTKRQYFDAPKEKALKFDDQSLQDLVDQDLSKEQIAQRLGVTKMAVHHRLKKLKSRQANINPEVLAETDRVDCKAPLTVQEKLFLDLHLTEGKSIKDAMNQAGFIDDLPERTLYFRAKKIIQKYEVRAEDHRNIMRAVGAGEARVITHLWHLAQNSNSDGAKVQATTTLGKWLGMDKEQQQGGAGVTIIMQASQGPTQINVGAPGPISPPEPGQAVTVSYQHPIGQPGKPIQITALIFNFFRYHP